MNTFVLEQDPVAISVKFTEAYFIVELAGSRLLSIATGGGRAAAACRRAPGRAA